MNPNEITQYINIEVSANLNNSSKELDEISRITKEILARNPQLAESYEGIRRAVQRATSQVNGWQKMQLKAQKEINDSFDKLEHKINRTFNSLEDGANKALGPLIKIGTFVGAGFGFDAAFRQAMSFDKQMMSLGNQFRKYGIGAKELEERVGGLSKRLKMTKTDVAGLLAQMEKSGNFQSLDMMSKSLVQIHKMVGSDVQAISQLRSELDSFISQFPDLQNSIDRLNESDKVRIENQTQLLLMTGQISAAQFKQMQDYAKGATQISYAEQKKRDELQATQKAYAELQTTFQNIAIDVGRTLQPVLQGVANILRTYPDLTKAAVVGLGGLAATGATIATGIGVIGGTKRLLNTVGMFKGKGGKGNLSSLGGGALDNVVSTGAAMGLGGIQKVFVVGGRVAVTRNQIGSNLSSPIADMFGEVESLFAKKGPPPLPQSSSSLTGPLSKTSKFGRISRLGNIGDSILGNASSAKMFSGLGKFAKGVPLLGAALGGIDVYQSLKKDKDGKRDWAGAGLGAAAIGTAFIPIVGPFISAGITAFGALRQAVKSKQFDSNYEVKNLRSKDAADAQLQLKDTLRQMGDQFNANRIKEQSIFNKLGQSVDNLGKSSLLFSATVGGLQLLGITNKGQTAESDRQKFQDGIEKAMTNAIKQLAPSMGKADATTFVKNQARASTMATFNRRIDDINAQKEQKSWKDVFWNTGSMLGITPDAQERREGKAYEQEGKARQDRDDQIRAVLGKKPGEYLTDRERMGLKNGEILAKTMSAEEAQAKYQENYTLANNITQQMGGVQPGLVSQQSIQSQYERMNKLSGEMRGQKVFDRASGMTVGIDDESYIQAKDAASQLNEEIEKMDKTSADYNSKKQELATMEQTISAIEEKRAPYDKARMAIQQQINQQAAVMQDRIKATNELYQAQIQLLTSVNTLNDAGGASAADYSQSFRERLEVMRTSAKELLSAQEQQLIAEKAAAVAGEKAMEDRNNVLQKRVDDTSLAPAERSAAAAEIAANNANKSNTTLKIKGMEARMEASRRQAPIEAIRQESQLIQEFNKDKLGYSEVRGGYAGQLGELAQMGGNNQSALAARASQLGEIRTQRSLLGNRLGEADTSLENAKLNKQAAEDAVKQSQSGEERVLAEEKLKEATMRVNELQNTRNKIQSEIVRKSREEIDIALQAAKANQGALDLQTGKLSRMEAELELMQSIGMGLGASVQQRMQVIDQTKQMQKLQEEQLANNLKAQSDAQAELTAMMARGATASDLEAQQAKINALKIQEQETQTGILNTQIRQAQMTKTLRDGYISAISAMTAGSGMITKITIDQNKSMGMAVRQMGMLQSMSSGGVNDFAAAGRLNSSQFTVGGVRVGEANVGYGTYNGAGMDMGIADHLARAKKMQSDALNSMTSSAALQSGTGVGVAGIAEAIDGKKVPEYQQQTRPLTGSQDINLSNDTEVYTRPVAQETSGSVVVAKVAPTFNLAVTIDNSKTRKEWAELIAVELEKAMDGNGISGSRGYSADT